VKRASIDEKQRLYALGVPSLAWQRHIAEWPSVLQLGGVRVEGAQAGVVQAGGDCISVEASHGDDRMKMRTGIPPPPPPCSASACSISAQAPNTTTHPPTKRRASAIRSKLLLGIAVSFESMFRWPASCTLFTPRGRYFMAFSTASVTSLWPPRLRRDEQDACRRVARMRDSCRDAAAREHE
jgi:hypothetical protein